jgi:hypothetical protein
MYYVAFRKRRKRVKQRRISSRSVPRMHCPHLYTNLRKQAVDELTAELAAQKKVR